MIYSEEYMEHIEYTFAAFCKVVLCNAAISACRDIGRKQKQEILLGYLMEEKDCKPSTTDCYFQIQEQPTEFVAYGKVIEIENER